MDTFIRETATTLSAWSSSTTVRVDKADKMGADKGSDHWSSRSIRQASVTWFSAENRSLRRRKPRRSQHTSLVAEVDAENVPPR